MGERQESKALEGKEEFLKTLSKLEARYHKMKPVLEVTLRDPACDVEGYIVVHNTEISLNGPLHGEHGQGCGKGGTRITPDLDLDEVKMLAHKMALKNSAAGLPLGGCKSGLKASPDDVDFEQKYKRFVELSRSFLFENGGVFGGFGFDIGARPEHAVWACEALGSKRSFTGKPLNMGGTDYDNEGIAGYGVAVSARALLGVRNMPVEGASFAVQGVGAMGAAVVRYFSEFGGVLNAVADPRIGGGWRFEDGTVPSSALIEALSFMRFEDAHALLKAEAKPMQMDDILFCDVDIVFPCALQEVLHADNAAHVKAKMVVEGANGPCDNDAYNMFFDMGIDVVPDFIANPGGVIAAFVEMTSDVCDVDNLKNKTKALQAKEKSQDCITKNVQEMMELVARYNVRCVDAGMYMALQRIIGEG